MRRKKVLKWTGRLKKDGIRKCYEDFSMKVSKWKWKQR